VLLKPRVEVPSTELAELIVRVDGPPTVLVRLGRFPAASSATPTSRGRGRVQVNSPACRGGCRAKGAGAARDESTVCASLVTRPLGRRCDRG
jgi:hypothetical protein